MSPCQCDDSISFAKEKHADLKNEIILMRCNFRAAMFDPDPHIQRRSERCRTQSRERNREGPELTQPTEENRIPIEAMRDPPPPAKAPRKTSIRMDFIKERLECNFQFRQCRSNECRICSDQKCSAK